MTHKQQKREMKMIVILFVFINKEIMKRKAIVILNKPLVVFSLEKKIEHCNQLEKII